MHGNDTAWSLEASTSLDPFLHVGNLVLAKALQEFLGRPANFQHLSMLGLDETLVDGMIQESQQGIEVPFNVQQAAWLGVILKLRPRENLEHLFECPYPSRQCNKAICQVEHFLLALVHRRYDMEFRQSLMSYSLLHALGDNTNHSAAIPQGGVGDLTHQADICSSVDDFDVLLGQVLAKLLCISLICGQTALVGAAIHTDSSQRIHVRVLPCCSLDKRWHFPVIRRPLPLPAG